MISYYYKRVYKEIKRFLERIISPVQRLIYLLTFKIAQKLPFIKKLLPPRGYYEYFEDYSTDKFILYPEIIINLKLPEFTELKFAPEYIASVKKARVLGKEGLLILPDGMGVKELNYAPDEFNDTAKLFRNLTYLNGKTFYLCSTWALGYYHWMFEVLPKFHLLEKSGIKVDHIISNPILSKFQKESLEILNIDTSIFIQTNFESNFQCEELIIPSMPGFSGRQSPWQCEYLKKMNKNIKPAGIKSIFISREKATRRKVINENELWDYLKTKGFKKIHLENYTLKEQIGIMKSAEVVIAPHGAGVGNTVFCVNKIKLIELFPPNYINNCYWVLADVLGFDYSYLVGDSSSGNQNTKIDLEKLKKLI